MFPAVTGFGLALLVTLRSAWVAPATPIVDVAELSGGFVSCVAEAAVAVSVITVPAGVPAMTVYFAVIVPVEPTGTLGFEQLTGAVFGQVHVPPPEVTTDTFWKVVLAGVASVKVAVVHTLGPLFVTVCV